MRSCTGRKAASGDGARRSPEQWISSRAERRGEAEHRILLLRTQMGLWEAGMAPWGCYSDGDGVWVGCRCSQAG